MIPYPKNPAPPLVALLIAGASSAAALFVTQGLISNRTEKLVTGLASILIPLGYLVLTGVVHHAQARVTAARIMMSQPTTQHLPA